MEVKLKPYGENGLLVFALGETERGSLLDALRGSLPPGCFEYVVGFDSILFLFEQAPSRVNLSAWLAPIDAKKVMHSKSKLHRVPVRYDGPDLNRVAEELGLAVEAVVEIHSAPVYSVRMMGFSPGFPYLDGLDTRLHLPRRASPRTWIEPGSVAIGGPHAGIYSVASPGGWHLLGRTEFVLFHRDAARAPHSMPGEIFTLSPGDQLKFLPASGCP